MQVSQESQASASIISFYSQPMKPNDPYSNQAFQILNNDNGTSRKKAEVTIQASPEQFFTLESTPAAECAMYNSPIVSVSSSRSPFSSQYSHEYTSDCQQSPDYTYGSPVSESSEVDEEQRMMHAFWALKNVLGPESDFDDSGSFNGVVTQPSSFTRYNRILDMAQQWDLKQLLLTCADIISEADSIAFSERHVAVSAAEALFDLLEKRVSVTGDPIQRLGAYIVEGLRARLLSSGSIIYKKLKCKEPQPQPTGHELMSYMQVLAQILPYYKFAYISSNVIIKEAMENESRIHIIDFQIAQGGQWVPFIQGLSRRPGGPPFIRITGVDDADSAYARGGELQLVGQKLAKVAVSCGVHFEFNIAGMSGCDVQFENLQIRYGEAIAVNFPYILHHMPDESVSTFNHRDRIIRLVKSLSPKVVTLVELESNTNTGNFSQRFKETLEYYTAMFESIDAANSQDDRKRVKAEEHCVAKDVVNILACEGTDRVERHEPFGKWRLRFMMAGFSQVHLSPSVSNDVRGMLKDYSPNFATGEAHGALFLGWKNRALSACSAWR